MLLVKGFYERLYKADDGSITADGGRVTELVARPLLSLWWPELTGLDAVAQVDLGRRGHKHQASHDLAVMSAELLLVADKRRRLAGTASERQTGENPGARAELRQFIRADGEMRQRSRPVPAGEHPPARSVLRG